MESKEIRIEGHQFKLLIDQEAIAKIVATQANELNAKYKGKIVDIIVVLKGGYVFAADLCRQLTFEHRIHFVKFTSYEGMRSTQIVKNDIELEADLEDKNVLIVEDIIDSGHTMAYFLERLENENAHTIALCTFLLKPNALKEEFTIDHIGCEIDDGFVIGYGMDYNEKYRSLQSIYQKI